MIHPILSLHPLYHSQCQTPLSLHTEMSGKQDLTCLSRMAKSCSVFFTLLRTHFATQDLKQLKSNQNFTSSQLYI